jgi:hypothetical protein
MLAATVADASRSKHTVSLLYRRIGRLMLCGEIIAVCCGTTGSTLSVLLRYSETVFRKLLFLT